MKIKDNLKIKIAFQNLNLRLGLDIDMAFMLKCIKILTRRAYDRRIS